MKIHNLQIVNYKSIKNLNIQFRRINLLIGPNGSDKTAIIESLLLLSKLCKGYTISAEQIQDSICLHNSFLNITFKFEFEIPDIEFLSKIIHSHPEARDYFNKYIVEQKSRLLVQN